MMLEAVSFGTESLTLGISMDEARLFGPVRALMSSNFVLALWLSAGLVILSMAVMRMVLVRPLGRLSHYAKAMARGEAPRHIPDVSKVREISDLASTLDALFADLAEREVQRNRAEDALQRALAGDGAHGWRPGRRNLPMRMRRHASGHAIWNADATANGLRAA